MEENCTPSWCSQCLCPVLGWCQSAVQLVQKELSAITLPTTHYGRPSEGRVSFSPVAPVSKCAYSSRFLPGHQPFCAMPLVMTCHCAWPCKGLDVSSHQQSLMLKHFQKREMAPLRKECSVMLFLGSVRLCMLAKLCPMRPSCALFSMLRKLHTTFTFFVDNRMACHVGAKHPIRVHADGPSPCAFGQKQN